MKKRKPAQNGFTTVEVLLATAILVIFLASIAAYYRKLVDVSKATTRNIQASFLLEEGVEAVKFVRGNGWSAGIGSLSTTTVYYLYWSGSTWTTTTTPQVTDNFFTRSFALSDVYRNSTTDNIAAQGAGTYFDGGTKKLTVSVAWQRKQNTGTTTQSVETYIANIFGN